MTDYLSRAEVLNVTCPQCSAGPGVPCKGSRDKPRAALHHERVEQANRQNQLRQARERRAYDHATEMEDHPHVAFTIDDDEHQRIVNLLDHFRHTRGWAVPDRTLDDAIARHPSTFHVWLRAVEGRPDE